MSGLVFIDAAWMRATGMGFFLDRTSRSKAETRSHPIPVTTFNMADGWFLEIEFPVKTPTGELTMRAFIPKDRVIAVVQGAEAEDVMMGFKS